MKETFNLVWNLLHTTLVSFGSYKITIFNVILIAPILFADVVIIRLFLRITQKRKIKEKNYYKAVTRIFKILIHFLAFVGIMLILGVKLDNITDFISAILNFKIFTIAGTSISLITIIVMVIIVYISAKIAKVAQNYFNNNVFPRFKIEEGVRSSLSKLIGYTIIAIGVIVALQGVGIKLSALTVFAGVLGVGIGFGMQNITANFVSGVAILFERPIKEGDMVRLKNMIGRVQKIRLRATVIQTIYNEHLIVPNSEFVNSIVENMSYGDLRLRISVKVGVAYGSDPQVVKKALLEAAKDTENILDSPKPVVYLNEFGDSSLNFELLVWIGRPADKFQATSDLHFTILDKFRKYNIVIPFPQTDVWIKEMPS